ncbi:MAG TPA: SDR family oxidoreductase [Gemmatimonadales bacterium]|nr:SDR family oxidoreductase [Gemmatimonadales bacterium]
MELRGRAALVTGAGVRIGRVIAHALQRRGCNVAIHYHSSEHGARQTAVEGETMGLRTALLQADLSDPAQAVALAERAAAALGGLDVLVNSAAVMERHPFPDITPEEWNRTMDLNLRAPFFVAQGASRVMGETGGVIINIADLAAFERWTGYPAHVISKAGVVVMTELLARALAPRIRVNAVAPGAVLLPDDWSEEARRRFAETTPLRRLGTPDDVARAVLYLLESDYVTGETVVVDGGRRIR